MSLIDAEISPNSSISYSKLEHVPIPAPVSAQEIEVLPNKDKDGNNYLKVLLLSNKLTRNKWIAPFKNIGELPKEVKESFLNVPWVQKHDYEFYRRMKEIMESSGKSDDDIVKSLIEESAKQKSGYIDHIFEGNPNDTALYGQVKITDPVENEYINKYNRPSQGFSSPGIYGAYELDNDGTMVYNVGTIRAFHQSGVRDPAFPPEEAAVKGVCKNGNSESCKKALAFASYDPPISSDVIPAPPMENVNNTCGCNKDINTMSNNQSQVTTTVTDTAGNPTATVTSPQPQIIYSNNTSTGEFVKGAVNSTAEAIEKAKQEVANIKAVEQKEAAESNKKEEKSQEEREQELQLKEFKKIIEQERAEKQEMRNFFLEELLNAHLPRDGFKNDEAYDSEKNVTKSFINKYNMGLEDAKWIINKVAKGIPKEENNAGKPTKKDVGVAGFYNPDNFLKNNGTSSGSVPQHQSNGNKSELDDSEYPIKF